MLANAFTDADREDRAQRRQRAEVLAERRLTADAGRPDAHRGALSDYLTWSNWIEAADGGTAP